MKTSKKTILALFMVMVVVAGIATTSGDVMQRNGGKPPKPGFEAP